MNDKVGYDMTITHSVNIAHRRKHLSRARIDSQETINRRTSGAQSLTWPQKLNGYMAKNNANNRS